MSRDSRTAWRPLAVLLTTVSLASPMALGGQNDDPNEWPVIGMHPGHEPGLMYLHFADGVPPDEAMEGLSLPGMPDHIPLMIGAEWTSATGDLDLEVLSDMHATAEATLQQSIPKPWQGVYVRLQGGTDTWAAIEAARELAWVTQAIPVPMVVNEPFVGQPDYESDQEYLGSTADNGIGADAIWNVYGITGQGIQFCDIEYEFGDGHCDLPAVTSLGPQYSAFGPHHGTATIGQVVALDDSVGTTGVAHGVDQTYFHPSFIRLTPGLRLGIDFAILKAGATMNPGDVILLEAQTAGPRFNPNSNTQAGLIPVEWFEPNYHAIRIATANGRVVVEAAGNGREDLDDPLYSLEIPYLGKINDGHWPFLAERDSGAIIVGAGRSGKFGMDRTRSSFSNFGSTVDLQGWGDNIVTTGPSSSSTGTIWSVSGCEYRDDFGGTSGASPIVAGACILVQSWCKANLGSPLSPAGLKWRLQLSGQPQQSQFGIPIEEERIGPLPDLMACIDALGGGESDLLVPWEYATIQEAADAAQLGDRILVGPGTWDGVYSSNKPLVIQSTDGPMFTFIDGGGLSGCIVCNNGDLTIDGFTIQDCWSQRGAGVFFSGDNLVVKNCRFLNNHATGTGGAIHAEGMQAALQDCSFKENTAEFSGGGLYAIVDSLEADNCYLELNDSAYGGGIWASVQNLDIADCLFNRNSASNSAGAIDLTSSGSGSGTGAIADSHFMSNTGRRGAALVISSNDLQLQRCHFTDNVSDEQGGAMHIDGGHSVIEHCRFSGNIAGEGWYGGAIASLDWAAPDVSWSVFCDNTPDHITGPFNDMGVNCFADTCTDADEDNIPDSCQAAGDVNGDGEVNVEDLLAILNAFGDCEGCPEDLNGDGVVDVEDILAVLACWAGGC
ncbi:MAG: S8 family serine peptidase [Phycisphaerales bacterium]|nr:S8 family serine peptidase [Phycisphaerales bacterium]